jgi:secreted trypsin-like serine protease
VRSSASLLLLALAGCTGAAMDPGVAEEPIIGGTADAADASVVLLYMTIPAQTGGSLCTGEVVSPHVILTAAHCTGGEDPSVTNAIWRVYLGDDFSKATAADMLAVKEAHYNPKFDINNLPAGNDVGVAILANPLPATMVPLPFNRTSMDVGFDGKQVRFVGYGLDNAAAQSGAGIKRTTTTTLTDHTALIIHFSDATHETCNGDSGGPAFMTLAGKETIVGLTSYGDVNCNMGGYDTRVDAMAAWIDGYIQSADPGFGQSGGSTPPSSSSTPPSPSGGTQTPPTSSVTPMPPSSAGTGGVGASCVSDHDCQSHLCGLADNGTRQCFAADANQVRGGMGCSMASSASRAGDGGPAAALMLILGLVVKLGRAHRRARRC